MIGANDSQPIGWFAGPGPNKNSRWITGTSEETVKERLKEGEKQRKDDVPEKRQKKNCKTNQTGIVSLNQTDSDRSVLEDKGSIPTVLCRYR